MRGWKRAAAVGAVTLWSAGCAFTSGEKVFDLYDLNATDVGSTVRGGTRTQILITEPGTVQAFNTNQIVVRTEGNSLGYLTGARWTDSLPKLVQARLVETFEKSGRVGAVGTPGEGLFINYSVRLNIRFFGIERSGSRAATVEFGAKILHEGTGRVVASQSFAHTVPAGAETAGAIDALDRAFDAATRDLAQWVFAKI